jgi:hypothetical protein
MRFHLENRLRKLGASVPGKAFRSHRVIGDSAEECEEQRQAMIEAGEADEADDFMFRIIVTPCMRPDGSMIPPRLFE